MLFLGPVIMHPSAVSSIIFSKGILMKFHSVPAFPDPCPDPLTGLSL